MLALVAAAAAFSAPIPVDANSWFVGFPAHPKIGPLTLVATTIIVNRHGYTESCNASTVMGEPSWGPFTCQLIRVNGNFHPAQIDGRTTYGVYRLRNAWAEHGPTPPDLKVWDFEVALTNVPADVDLPILRKIAFVVDASGAVHECQAAGSWSHPELASQACAQLRQKLEISPARTRSGKAVESVQDAAVRLVAAPS